MEIKRFLHRLIQGIDKSLNKNHNMLTVIYIVTSQGK